MIDLPVDTIISGDCIGVLSTLPPNSVDLIFADPPYNLQLPGSDLHRPDHSKVDGVTDKWDTFSSFQEYDDFTKMWFGQCLRVLKDTGSIWVIGTYHNIFRVGKIVMDCGCWIQNDILWVKTNPMPNFRGVRFTNAHETLIWAKKSKTARCTFNYRAMKNLNDEKQMRSDWQLPVCPRSERIFIDGKKSHPTQKPEALLYRIIMATSNPGEVVLDPFFGSGTTGVVAKKLGRKWIGIERDKGYVSIAQERIDGAGSVSSDDRLYVSACARKAPRVAFGRLVESGLIAVGQGLVSKDGKYSVVVAADGTVITPDGIRGSIHSVAKQVQEIASCNGWTYWHSGEEPIDVSREEYRKKFLPDD